MQRLLWRIKKYIFSEIDESISTFVKHWLQRLLKETCGLTFCFAAGPAMHLLYLADWGTSLILGRREVHIDCCHCRFLSLLSLVIRCVAVLRSDVEIIISSFQIWRDIVKFTGRKNLPSTQQSLKTKLSLLEGVEAFFNMTDASGL